MAKPKGLSPADLQLWAAYSQNLVLLPGKTRLAVEPAPVVAPAAMVARTAPGRVGPKTANGVDKATWRKFTTGQTRATSRLDLHGLTAARAHHAVTQFIQHGFAEQQRCLEIITGKGDVLARELPHWLEAPGLRPMILGMAHPHAGNTGAVRILLRRRR